MTRYGQNILDIINTAEEHMTAEQVFFALKKRFASVVMATVYNNLNSLYQQGKIRKISVEGQPDRYDKNTRHDHLVCRRCGRLTDIYLSDLTDDLEKQVGFEIEVYDLKIHYLCPECKKASS
ncbi:Fur family transcriptional regulator [Luxibacter massiliensis]|uniref:Fur family transcriptional regulator n=1 Tax=Luxibacter massiliensis TaxID=2219695 RepID=UPI000F05C662|nr:transcriptional repressor [Luxibacter massiliensis]